MQATTHPQKAQIEDDYARTDESTQLKNEFRSCLVASC
jgi:hypothetical protein